MESFAVRIFLGIDGGGTKTDFLLSEESGRVLAVHRGSSAYYPQIGMQAVRTMLLEGIGEIVRQAGIAPGDIEFSFLGLPGHGEDTALEGELNAVVATLLPASRHRCGNDMVCGWAGALAGREGINIVAGTGSIAYGEYAGRHARAGGWGDLFSDEGSAHWIAREALTLFSRMADGREPRAPLYDLLREHLALGHDLDLCAAIYGPPAMSRGDIAALAPLAAHAAQQGDAAARRIFERGARELADIVHAARDTLGAKPEFAMPVSYSGGVFRATASMAPLLEAALAAGERRYEFLSPRLPPAAGAVLYAAKLAGCAPTAALIEGLQASLLLQGRTEVR